ncbi:helix-turn-helix transcriptional regulator [uncultured Sphingomonas sp.]|uniref:helix-turn-helix transcriptional regulator n=1 Tax=uncultured Sphingomonas sp. TaxID=158754 RepID=UPI0035CC17AC
MGVDPALIERIYEAGALPELWPDVLEAITDAVGGFGATFVAQSPDGVAITSTPRIERIVSDYIAEGWAADPEYAAPLHADLYPGFRAETHYRTIAEIERLPVHIHFLAPRGLIAGVGTVLQGARDDMLQMAVEGLPSYPAAEAAALWLDQVRAPIARSFSLAARLRERQAGTAVASLDLAGVAAAIVSGDGRLRAANDRFARRLGDRLIDRPAGLRFADRFLQARFAEALAALGVGAGVRSIAVAPTDGQPACAIHLLPLRRGARDVFGWDGILLLLAEAANASVPNADLLRLLFDLTPAEARLARLLVEGQALGSTGRSLGITDATARVHLRRIFAKTGVTRQAELVRLLSGLGGPG